MNMLGVDFVAALAGGLLGVLSSRAATAPPPNIILIYNLRADLGETNNIAAQNLTIVKRLQSLMMRAHTDSPDWPTHRPVRDRPTTNATPRAPR